MNYGIRVKNPLTKPVRVEVIDGKTIIRETTLDPGATKFISLVKKGTYDVRATILDREPGAGPLTGITVVDELGPAGIALLNHEDIAQAPAKPINMQNTAELLFKFWRDIVVWKVQVGSIGELTAVEIDPVEGVLWRLKISKPGDGKNGGVVSELARTTTFSGRQITGGEIVKLQAKSKTGDKVVASGSISGLESMVSEDVSPVRVGTRAEEKEEEIVVRSLGDMFDELRSKEVVV